MSQTDQPQQTGADASRAGHDVAACPDSAGSGDSAGMDAAVVRRAAHQLNNCLTALYCQFDLLIAELERGGRHPAREHIEGLLSEASGEVRTLLAVCRDADRKATRRADG